MKKNSPKPNLSRHGHDLSMRRMFTCPVGMLLPVFKDFATEGDTYKLNSSTFVRTEAVDTAAFMRLKLHVDWFFAPIEQMYAFWNEFFYGTQDVMTSFTTTGSDPEDKSIPTNNYSLPTTPIYRLLQSDNSFFVAKDAQGNDYATTDEFGIPKLWNARRLMDMLGYGSVSHNSVFLDHSNLPTTNNESWFPLYYLAYHKIFHSHYLNSLYFRNNPLEYNVDRFYGNTIPANIASNILSHIHYRPYRPDYFTDIQPSTVFNSNYENSMQLYFNSVFGRPGESHLTFDEVNGMQLQSQGGSTFTGTSGIPNTSITSNTNINLSDEFDFSLGNLRAAFALDRLLRITGSTGSHYSDQVLAHLGFKVPEGIKKEAYFIGSQVTDININEVVATATTLDGSNGSVLGDIAGKGFGQTPGQQDLKFTAPCVGVLMAISSIEPIVDYASYRPDIDNRYLQPLDFWRPETDSLGMQPLFDGYADINYIGSTNANSQSRNYILGWQPRHQELKQKYDVVNEGFHSTNRKRWVGFKQELYNSDDANNVQATPTDFSVFYIAPQYTNLIFAQSVPYYGIQGQLLGIDPTQYWKDESLSANFIYNSDNFLVNMQLNVFKVSYMSADSLPKFL